MPTKFSPEELTTKERPAFDRLLSKIPYYKKKYKDPQDVEITIRTAKIRDVAHVVSLEYIMLADLPNVKNLSYPRIKNDIKSSLEKINPIMLVVERDGKIVAFVWGYDLSKEEFPELANYLSSGARNHISYINELVVEQSLRRQGIEGDLLDSYKELAGRIGIDDLVLMTRNSDAMKLYKEKKGYKQIVDPESNQEIISRSKGGAYYFLHSEIRQL
jgi:ribosomal protein S18 acetylase RimI-like enzyme